jgi:chitosanase
MDMITKSLIKQILLAFEQGSSHIQYEKLYVFKDGPNKIKQITLSFGITEYGNLKTLVEAYCKTNTEKSLKLKKYIDVIGKTPLADNQEFKESLKQAGSDKVMQLCQDAAFDTMYITPAYNWCSDNGLVEPLSHLVICDSYLHSGSILRLLRNKFSEKLPKFGGNEKNWITQYCTARRDWLENHTNKILNPTAKRMDFALSLINNNDWNLQETQYVVEGVKIANK